VANSGWIIEPTIYHDSLQSMVTYISQVRHLSSLDGASVVKIDDASRQKSPEILSHVTTKNR